MYLNQITIIGNATRDAETRETRSEKKRTTFAVAVNAGQEQVDFFEVVCWDKNWSDDLVKKGTPVLVQGSMRSRKSDEGITYWTVVANKVLVFNNKSSEKKTNGENGKKKSKNDGYEIYQP